MASQDSFVTEAPFASLSVSTFHLQLLLVEGDRARHLLPSVPGQREVVGVVWGEG
jgi:hypothetical protein